MSIALITGSAGLIGSEAVRYFAAKGMHVVGIDNDMRKYFFGPEASTEWMRKELEATFDHGETDGYGLWLDAAVKDNPVYSEHWAGKRDVTVRIEADQIVIRRAGSAEESESEQDSDSDDDE